MLRVIKYLAILIIFSCLQTETSYADHIIGSDFSYKCSANNDSIFDVTYNFYRDCNGCYVLGQSPKCGTTENCASSLTAPTSLTVTCLKGGSYSGTLTMTRQSITDITKTCKSVKSRCQQPCNGSFPYGIEKHTFTGTLDLRQAMKKGCCLIEISALLYVRNVGITTGQSQQSFYTSCEINVCDAVCNTSPTLTNDPVAILCCNQPYVFNNGAVDFADGDSISYSFAPAYRAQNTQCTYSGVRTPDNPISTYYPGTLKFPYSNPNSNPPIGCYLDDETGDIIFTPTSCGEVAVVVVQMTEWRKDTTGKYKKIGVTRRDMQFIVMTCPDNNPPQITNTKYSYRACEGSQICFNITTDDKVKKPPPPLPAPDPDTVTLTWNRGIPGATFTILDTTKRLKTGQFCWTPPLGSHSTLPYSFTATVTDDACPLAASATRAFQIFVDPIAEAERTITKLECGRYAIASEPKTGFRNPPRYTWQLKDSNGVIIFGRTHGYFESTNSYISGRQYDTIQFRKGGKYILHHTINNAPKCPNDYYDTIDVPPLLEVDLALGPDTFVCANTTLRLNSQVKNGVPTYSYAWGTGDTTTGIDIQLPKTTADSAFYIEVRDSNGCVAWDSVVVFRRENPYVSIGDDRRICTYDTINLNPVDSLAMWDDPRDTSMTFVQQGDTLYKQWYRDGVEISTDSALSGVHIKGLYVLHVTDSLGCYGADTINLFVNDTVTANAGLDQVLCWNDLLELIGTELDTAGKDKSGTFRWWDINNPLGRISKGTKDTLSYNIKNTTTFQLELFVTEDTTTCYDADTVLVTVNQLPQWNMPSDMAICHDAGNVNLRLSEDNAAKGGTWSCPAKPSLIQNGYTFITDSAGHATNSVTNVIYYRYVDPATSCERTDSFIIKVNPLPKVLLRDGYFCQDKGIVDVQDDKIIALPGGATLNLGRQTWKCLNCGPYNASDIIKDFGSGAPGGLQDYKLIVDENAMPLGSKTSDSITIELEFRNVYGCYNRDTASITVTKVPKIDFLPFRDFCWDEGLVDLKEESKVTPYDGIWMARDSSGFASAASLNAALKGDTLNGDTLNTMATPQPQEGGSFTYVLRYYHDRSGCPTWRDTTLTIRGLPVPIIATKPLADVHNTAEPYQFCQTDDKVDLTANYSGGTWSSSEPGALSGASFYPSNVGNYNTPINISYRYQDIYGCTGADTVQVEVHKQHVLNLPADTAFCRYSDQMSLNLKASYEEAAGIFWLPLRGGTVSNQTSTDITYTFASSTDSVTQLLLYAQTQEGNGNVCPFVDGVMSITVHPKPKARISGDTLDGCQPVDINFTTTILNNIDPAASKYEWLYQDGGSDNVQNPTYRFETIGPNDVQLKLTSAFGCDTTLDLRVEVYPIPVAKFTPDPNNSTTAALPKFNFVNQSTVDPALSSVIDRSEWDFGIINQSDDTSSLFSPLFFYPADTGTYTVELTVYTQYGCSASYNHDVIIGPDLLVYIPNAFSPEGSGPGENEGFRAVVNDAAKTYHIVLFNRWGEVIWESTDRMEEWDGRYGSTKRDQNGNITQTNREPVPQGVYSYYLEVVSWKDETFTYSGTVTLIR